MSAEMAQTGWMQQDTESNMAQQSVAQPLLEEYQALGGQPEVESATRWNINWRGALARFGVITGAALASFGALPAANSEAKSTAKIVVGQSIDGVSMGQTQAQVRHELGKPTRKSGGHGTVPEGWDYGKLPYLSLAFNKDVDLIQTSYTAFKTNKDVGVGSSFAEVQKAYPDATCNSTYGAPTCVVQTEHDGTPVYTQFISFTLPPVEDVSMVAIGLALG